MPHICTWVCNHATAMSPSADVDDNTCTICLDSTEENTITITLACGHKFHSQSAVDLFPILAALFAATTPTATTVTRPDSKSPTTGFLTRRRCATPWTPSKTMNSQKKHVLTMLHKSGVTVDQASAEDNRTDKPTQRMKTTLRKWKKERSAARKDAKDKDRTLAILEEAVYAKIGAFQKKLWTTFQNKHKTKIKEVEVAKKTLAIATTQMHNSQLRPAKKYGFSGRFNSRRFRSRRATREDVDEEVNDD